MVTAKHDLGVVDDVEREDDRADRRVTNLGIAEVSLFTIN